MRPVQSHFNLAGAMIIVGSSVVVGKIVALAMPVFLASLLRFALAVAVLWPLLRARGGLPKMDRHDWGLLFLLALTGQFLFTVCLLYGLRLTSALEAGVITSTSPGVIGLLAWLLFRERPGGRGLIALALTLAGLVLVNLKPGGSNSGGAALWGNLLVLAAVLGEAMFSIIAKYLRAPISPLAIAFVLSLMGLAMFLPPGLVEAWRWNWSLLTVEAGLSVVYYGLAVTVLAYILWFRGLAEVTPATAGLFTALMPVSAVGLSWLVLGETLAPRVAVGGAAVVAGLVLKALAMVGNSSGKRPAVSRLRGRVRPPVKASEGSNRPLK